MKLPILLVESNTLVRQAVGMTAASLALGPVLQAASIQAAQRMLQAQEFSAIILPLHSEGDENGQQFFGLLEALRAGATRCSHATSVYVTASACGKDEVEQLLAAKVRRILIKPFKTRTLIDVLAEIAGEATSPRTAAA